MGQSPPPPHLKPSDNQDTPTLQKVNERSSWVERSNTYTVVNRQREQEWWINTGTLDNRQQSKSLQDRTTSRAPLPTKRTRTKQPQQATKERPMGPSSPFSFAPLYFFSICVVLSFLYPLILAVAVVFVHWYETRTLPSNQTTTSTTTVATITTTTTTTTKTIQQQNTSNIRKKCLIALQPTIQSLVLLRLKVLRPTLGVILLSL